MMKIDNNRIYAMLKTMGSQPYPWSRVTSLGKAWRFEVFLKRPQYLSLDSSLVHPITSRCQPSFYNMQVR